MRSFPSNSWIRADPIARSTADKCNLNDLSFWGGTYTGGDTKYYFIFPRASCCFSPQTNSWSALSFNNGLKGCTFPDRFDINLRIKLILPIKDWSSVLFIGATTCLIVVMLFCPTSMPLSWTMKPRNCPADTPKAYLHGFILSPCFLVHSNVLRRSARWSWRPFDLTTTSSIYISTILPMISWKI